MESLRSAQWSKISVRNRLEPKLRQNAIEYSRSYLRWRRYFDSNGFAISSQVDDQTWVNAPSLDALRSGTAREVEVSGEDFAFAVCDFEIEFLHGK